MALPMEQIQPREGLFEKFVKAVDEHIVDVETVSEGNRDKLANIQGNAFGVENVLIDRCDPPVIVESLAFEAGRSIVLIGPNGSGKSTIFDAIMEKADARFNLKQGKGALVFGKPVHMRDRLRISRLNQEEILEPIKDVPAGDVLDMAVEKFKTEFEVDWMDDNKYDQNLANEEARQRIEELRGQIVDLFDMKEFLVTEVGKLSGGERTKLSIFMVLLSEPDILLLDEPTNHLDLESIAKLAALFKKYNEAGVSIANVSHVHWYLEQAGNGGVIEIQMDGKQRTVKKSNSPYIKFIKDQSRSEFTTIEKPLEWACKDNVKAGDHITTMTEIITVPDSPLIDIEMDGLHAGEVWVLSGNNGSGKTKLMEAIADKKKRRGLFVKEKGVNIAYMPQFWPKEVAEGTVEEFYYWIQDQINPNSPLVAKHLSDAARDIGFTRQGKSERLDKSFLHKKLSAFSGGEQRLLWFLAVSTFPEVDSLFLDEPTNHMDKNLQQFVIDAIRSFEGSVVMSTHDIKLLEAITESIGHKVGSSVKAKNMVLDKKDGKTTISNSEDNPVEYMKKKLIAAQNAAKKFKI